MTSHLKSRYSCMCASYVHFAFEILLCCMSCYDMGACFVSAIHIHIYIQLMLLFLEKQAVRATQDSPRRHVSLDPTGSSDSTDRVLNPSVSRPGHFLKAPPIGDVPRVNPSSPSNFQAGWDVLTPPADIRNAHTRTTHAHELSPPFTGSFDLAQLDDRGKARLSEAPGLTASNKGLPGWCPPQSTSDYKAAAGNSATHAGLECRLTLPHGTRGHKRPRLEDKLTEVINKA